ncbi:MAG: translation initiation factor IF-2 [Parcubacteria group bacterium Gr01-1014_56]|nr:MAG: translation initiation factor IF-2 [Parcubacteria group bacterium Gr01-1014_56]
MSVKTPQKGPRPPIVAIVGHIDHGKSTLLDYVRTSNVVSGEAGGITQHLSAYEAVHTNATGEHKITFLDTPGHEAFRAMRSRGLEVADVAILVVSSEEGAKPQTLEALKLIEETKIPYIVAFTKIDKPGANVEKAKMSMLEKGVYLEGLGGNVPYVAVSGKSGEGIPELLDLILLAGELEEISTDPSAPGSGVVIEAHVDNKRGNTATLIVQDGTLKSGEYIVSGEATAPVRIMENFLGKAIKEASAGSPVGIVGFSVLPKVGAAWHTVEKKKDAEAEALLNRPIKQNIAPAQKAELAEGEVEPLHIILPLVIKTDVAGTAEAVEHELRKLPQDSRLEVRIVSRGVGPISENDVKLAGSGTPSGIVVGFNVKVEGVARELAERQGVSLGVFDIIYKLTEWLGEELAKRQPREKTEEQSGLARVLKVFSTAKGKVILGGKVEEGALTQGEEVKIMRRDLELGRGVITSLQAQKKDVKSVEPGSEFGAQIKTSAEPAHGDTLLAVKVVYK